MLFYSFFKTLIDKEITIELKNSLRITGKLLSVDQFLNFKLDDILVQEIEKYPHMQNLKNCFIRGSVVRYVQMNPEEVDTELLQDATRRELQQE